MPETVQVHAGLTSGPSSSPDRSVVLVPYYATVDQECEKGLEALKHAGVSVRRASFSAIDLLRSIMLSHALRDGFETILFIDSDIGFDPADALRLLARPEPVVAGVYMLKNGRDYSGVFAKGVDRVVFGPAAPALYPMMYASTGFLRIKSSVLHRMIEELKLPECHFGSTKGIFPFFLPLCVPDGRGGTRYLTEDYSFSHRVRQLGITPMADTSIRLFHYGKYGYSYADLNPRQRFDNYTLQISYPEDGDRP